MKEYYVLAWNNETLTQKIMAGPVSHGEAITTLAEATRGELVNLGVCKDKESAETEYEKARWGVEETCLRASEECSVITYPGIDKINCKEWLQVVKYRQQEQKEA